MKSPKGFRGKYFSLAAILALNATLTLASNVQSVVDTQEQLQTPRENATSEEETLLSELNAHVMVVSKKIKAQKSEVYTASKSLVSATNVTDNVSIITSEELSLKGITSVAEALNTISGITVTSSGSLGTTQSVFIQGLSNKYTLLMVDGVRYNDPSNTSGAEFSHLLIGDIDRIEVIKGSQSGVWGADAAAGVINIITKRASSGTHGSVGGETGSYGRKSANISLAHKTDKLDVILSVQRITEDGFTSQAPWGKNIDDYEDDPYQNTTINLKTGYWINQNNRIESGYHDTNALSSYDGSTLNDYRNSDVRNRSGYVTYKFLSGNHALESTLSNSNFHKKELGTTSGVNDYAGNIPFVELKDTWKYFDNSILVMGGSYEKREIHYTKIGDSEKELDDNSKALYMNNSNKFGNIVLSEALRYDSFSAFENKVTGKVGAKYLFSDHLNVYANFGTAYKTPSMLDMINVWGTSNFDLKPENIQSLNIGLYYSGLTINFFRNEIEDMINWDTGTSKNVNIAGTSVMKGVEISYEQQFLQSLLLGANYTYVDAQKEDGTRLTRRPRYQTSLYATYMPTQKLTLNANGTYIGSRADQDFSTWPATNVETGNYFVANAKVNYAIDKTWNVYLKANNLFNRYYQTAYGYASAGRSFYLGTQVSF
jgi:vitamin B12 transporter